MRKIPFQARWLAVALPALAGLTFDLLMVYRLPHLPVVFARIDVGSLLLLVGLLLTALLVAWLIYLERSGRKMRQVSEDVQSQAADERRRFLRRLDHELKNPLTAIRAGLANLRESPSPEMRGEALESVDAQAVRLSRLAADLRKLAELETRPLERIPVNIGALLEDAVTLAQDLPTSGTRHLVLSVPQVPWPLPNISGDQDLLFLAVHNLLDNAIKFTRPGDTVEVRGYEDGSRVVVEVADTGPGIPDEEMPHVWEELYRGQSARGIPGSGLGLALVRAIAERHNGEVLLRSRAGQGTVFSLRLPIS